jgi:hypothetical protein
VGVEALNLGGVWFSFFRPVDQLYRYFCNFIWYVLR